MANLTIEEWLEEKNVNEAVGAAITEAAKARAENVHEAIAAALIDQSGSAIGALSEALRQIGDVKGDKVEFLLRKLKPGKGGGSKPPATRPNQLFDAHCHYLNFAQESEGMDALIEAMDKHGVGHAALTGCPLKKSWIAMDQKPPKHPLYDDGDLYFYSMTDALVGQDLNAWKEKTGDTKRFIQLACGFNLGDMGVGKEFMRTFQRFPAIGGIGEVLLQSDDYNNMTIKGSNWTYDKPAVENLLKCLSAEQKSKKRPLPFVFYGEARSVTTKPYRDAFEYLDDIEKVVDFAGNLNPPVHCLWAAGGVFARGLWEGYPDKVMAILDRHPNLMISFTPLVLGGKLKGITRDCALDIATKYPSQICLGTTARGLFLTAPPQEFTDQVAAYHDQIMTLNKFIDDLNSKAGAETAHKVRYANAARIYGVDMKGGGAPPELVGKKPHTPSLKKALSHGGTGKGFHFLASLSYGGGGGGTKKKVCEASRTDKEWTTIDCHLHLLDFLQKSSGTSAALKAMDGCKVERALVFGMPCCKKWCFYRPEQPLYYQDDNAPCYVYAFADQMVADAWLALTDTDRARFAPTFAAFDPTDLAAISHCRRMYNKYPKMWRAVGELMCRHDDLTTMLLDREVPRVNHPALDAIYEFCIETDMPVCVHHNADRVGDMDGGFEYVKEVEDVLKKHTTLKFVWVHAGVSRRAFEDTHHEMIDRMCTTYPNLMVDISWVVWEDVICDADGNIKQGWIDCIEKHNTKFFIGSDNVAQYFPINDVSTNLLASNITKYWPLFDKLSPAAGQNVAYQNAYNLYFATWDIPKGEGGDIRYQRMPSYYQTEMLDPKQGTFVTGKATELDDDGMY